MSTSVEKRKLMAESDLYRDEFDRELKEVKYQTNELLKKALIIGGSLAVTYFLFQQFASRKKKKRTLIQSTLPKVEGDPSQEVRIIETPSRFSAIASEVGSKLVNEATVFLLSIAKEKLMELLAPKDPKTSTDDDSFETTRK